MSTYNNNKDDLDLRVVISYRKERGEKFPLYLGLPLQRGLFEKWLSRRAKCPGESTGRRGKLEEFAYVAQVLSSSRFLGSLGLRKKAVE